MTAAGMLNGVAVDLFDYTLNEVREQAEQAAHDSRLPALVLRPAMRGKVVVEMFTPKNTPTENRLLTIKQTLELLDGCAGSTALFAHPNLPRAILRKLALIDATLRGHGGVA